MEKIFMPPPKPDFDASKRYVRICKERPDGFIEFEFAIGEPELYVELLLSTKAFEEFCTKNHVTFLETNTKTASTWVERMTDASHKLYGDLP